MPFLNVCDNVQIYKQLTCSLWLMFRTKRSCSGSKRWQSLKTPTEVRQCNRQQKNKRTFHVIQFQQYL